MDNWHKGIEKRVLQRLEVVHREERLMLFDDFQQISKQV
jgi:hypothetical protein